MASRWSEDDRGLGVRDLIRQLVGEIGLLASQTATLLKAEFRNGVSELGRQLVLLLISAAGVVLGLGLLLVAMALWIGALVDSPPGGFALTAGGMILGATLVAWMSVRRLRRLRLYPETTIRELGKTIDLLQGEPSQPGRPVPSR